MWWKMHMSASLDKNMPPFKLNTPVSVAILYFGGTAEDLQDTEITVKQMVEALKRRGFAVTAVQVTRKNWRKAIKTPGLVVVNLVEDPTWELYVKVGEALEKQGRAQLGHDLKTFRYATRKSRLKNLMVRLGISTPSFRIVTGRSKVETIKGMEYPLIVKPSEQHAGIGISQDSVVIDKDELGQRVKYLRDNFGGEVLVEEFVEGREIHVTVVGNGRHAVCLPLVELEFKGEFSDNWNLYSYEAKWVKDSWEYWNVPVRPVTNIAAKVEKKIEKLALLAYKELGCRDIARFDIRLNEKDVPFIVDVNTNPSLCYDELDATWVAARTLGWKYEDLIENLVAIAYKRVYRGVSEKTRKLNYLQLVEK